MLLLTNCEIHVGKYPDRSFEVRTERSKVCTKTKVRIFSRMDRINWPIRASLYSHNQRPKTSLNSELDIFVSSLNAAVGRELFSNSSILFKVKLSLKNQNLRKNLCRPTYLRIEIGLRFPRSNTPFWRSSTVLDGPLMKGSENTVFAYFENEVGPGVLQSSVQQICNLQKIHTTRTESTNLRSNTPFWRSSTVLDGPLMKGSENTVYAYFENEVGPGVLQSSVQQICNPQNFTQQGQNRQIISCSWFLPLVFFQHLHLLNVAWSTPGLISFSDSLHCLIILFSECSISQSNCVFLSGYTIRYTIDQNPS